MASALLTSPLMIMKRIYRSSLDLSAKKWKKMKILKKKLKIANLNIFPRIFDAAKQHVFISKHPTLKKKSEGVFTTLDFLRNL
jgi:hypothetical protein